MRVGIVRSDIGSVYLSDVENRAQRCFSSEPAGQSRYFKKPTDAQFLELLNEYAPTGKRGNDGNATRNTTSNHTLRIRTTATSAFTVINVTAGGSVTKDTIAADLNTGFVNAGLLLKAVNEGNHIKFYTYGSLNGPGGRIEVDTAGHGSTLNAVLDNGWSGGFVQTAPTVSNLKSEIYPTDTTVDVSSNAILDNASWGDLPSDVAATLVEKVADLAAPRLVETGPVLLSFTYGILSKLASSSFQPGGDRGGLPAHVGAYLLEDDGSTPFTL